MAGRQQREIAASAAAGTDQRAQAVARSVSPPNVTYSATMLAFQAPPAAVTQPVTRYGKTAGR